MFFALAIACKSDLNFSPARNDINSVFFSSLMIFGWVKSNLICMEFPTVSPPPEKSCIINKMGSQSGRVCTRWGTWHLCRRQCAPCPFLCGLVFRIQELQNWNSRILRYELRKLS